MTDSDGRSPTAGPGERGLPESGEGVTRSRLLRGPAVAMAAAIIYDTSVMVEAARGSRKRDIYPNKSWDAVLASGGAD